MADDEVRLTIRFDGGLLVKRTLHRAMREVGVQIAGTSSDGRAATGYESILGELLGDAPSTYMLVVQGELPQIKRAIAQCRQHHPNSNLEAEDDNGTPVRDV